MIIIWFAVIVLVSLVIAGFVGWTASVWFLAGVVASLITGLLCQAGEGEW